MHTLIYYQSFLYRKALYDSSFLYILVSQFASENVGKMQNENTNENT